MREEALHREGSLGLRKGRERGQPERRHRRLDTMEERGRDAPRRDRGVARRRLLHAREERIGIVYVPPRGHDDAVARALALRVERDSEGITQRALMCDSDGLWLAKDRSGKLEAWEAPDLGAIIAKIGGKA
jgi:hypothetical protein